MLEDSRALGPVPSGARPLVAVASRGGMIAATSCGRVVHLLQHAEVRCSWRLPAPVLSLQWWPDGTAVLAITQAGCSWRLTADLPPSENGDAEDSREVKRRRTEPEGRHVVRPVGSANRVQMSQLPPDFEVLVPCATASYCALACCRQAPPCLLPFPAWPQRAARYEPALELPQLRGGAGSCALCIGSSSSNAAGTDGGGVLPVAPALFHALIGGEGGALLVSDAAGDVRAAQLEQGGAPPLLPPPLIRLGEPLAALLLAPHAASVGASAAGRAVADTLVVVGRRGRLLLLCVSASGRLHRRVWQLDAVTCTTAACMVGRTLLYACLEGTFAVPLPAPDEAAEAAEAASARLWRGQTCEEWLDEAAWCGQERGHGRVPAMPVELLPIGSVPLCLQPLLLPPPAAAGEAEATAAVAVALCADGTLALLRAPPPHAPPASDATSAAAAAAAAGFAGGFMEQCVRRQLQLIRANSEQLAEARTALRHGERSLAELAAAARAMRAMSTRAHAWPLVVDGAASRPQLRLQVRNAADAALGAGWCLSAQLRHAPPLTTEEHDAGWAVGAQGGLSTSSCSVPLHGLGAGAAWEIELPLPLPPLHARATLLLTLCFRPGGGGSGAPVVCALLGERRLSLLHLLRPRGSRPAASGCLGLGLPGVLGAQLGATHAAPVSGVPHGGPPGAHAHVPPGSSALDTQCKLRLLPAAPAAPAARQQAAPAPVGAAPNSLASVLDALLDGGALARRGAAADGGRQEGRQEGVLAELPGGVQVSLRLGWEAERPTGGARRAAGLLVQVSRPEALWALRAALLHALLRSPQRCDAAPRLTTAAGAARQAAQRPAQQGAREEVELVARAELSAAAQEVHALQPLLRQQQQRLLELHETLYRLHQMRRLYRRRDGVSLRELSGEALRACHAAVEVHQALRSQLGCLSLCA